MEFRDYSAVARSQEISPESAFYRLKQLENREIVIGIIGQFWKPVARPVKINSLEEFLSFDRDGFCKAALNLRIVESGPSVCDVITETRVLSYGSAEAQFREYWRVIAPFSGLIRREILRKIKQRAEHPISRKGAKPQIKGKLLLTTENTDAHGCVARSRSERLIGCGKQKQLGYTFSNINFSQMLFIFAARISAPKARRNTRYQIRENPLSVFSRGYKSLRLCERNQSRLEGATDGGTGWNLYRGSEFHFRWILLKKLDLRKCKLQMRFLFRTRNTI